MYRKHDVILSFLDGTRAGSDVDSTGQANFPVGWPKEADEDTTGGAAAGGLGGGGHRRRGSHV
jgi:hypothetical protein